jgi:hypothetical protein
VSLLGGTPNDLGVGIMTVLDNVTLTSGTDWNQIGTVVMSGSGADNRAINSQYDAPPPDGTVDWSTVAAENFVGWAAEIVENPSTAAPPGLYFQHHQSMITEL